MWELPLYISRNAVRRGSHQNRKIKNRFRDEIYSELTFLGASWIFGYDDCWSTWKNEVRFLYCVIIFYKNNQTFRINVVNYTIVTETCQLFFWHAVLLCGLGSPLFCAAMGSVGELKVREWNSLLPNTESDCVSVWRVELVCTKRFSSETHSYRIPN